MVRGNLFPRAVRAFKVAQNIVADIVPAPKAAQHLPIPASSAAAQIQGMPVTAGLMCWDRVLEKKKNHKKCHLMSSALGPMPRGRSVAAAVGRFGVAAPISAPWNAVTDPRRRREIGRPLHAAQEEGAGQRRVWQCASGCSRRHGGEGSRANGFTAWGKLRFPCYRSRGSMKTLSKRTRSRAQ